MKIKLLPTLFCLMISLGLCAQKDLKVQAENLTLVAVNYGFYTPMGDLDQRFGENSMIGLSTSYKLKSNLLFGVDGNFIFGKTVYEPHILQNLMSENGEIFDEDSRIADILLLQRGYIINANAGKLFPIKALNPNSGILVKFGLGFMQHKIRIEHQNNRIPQLEGEYLKGYDRLVNGLSVHQFIGFMNISNKRLTNFYVGLDLHEGFVQGRRTYNYDTRTPGNEKRFDMFTGVKLGWMLPVYKRMAADYYID